MTTPSERPGLNWLAAALLGLGIGLIAALVLGFVLAGNRTHKMALATATQMAAGTLSAMQPAPTEPILEATPTLEPTPTPDPLEAALIAARAADEANDSQKVVDLLQPFFAQMQGNAAYTEYLDMIGRAESNLGFPLLAAGYYRMRYEIQPDAETLYNLAVACNDGGDLLCARDAYTRIVNEEVEGAAAYRDLAAEALAGVENLLQTATAQP